MRSCASCTAAIDDQDARFCGECGAPVAPDVVIHDERPAEAVLYVDDSTEQPPVMVIGADANETVPTAAHASNAGASPARNMGGSSPQHHSAAIQQSNVATQQPSAGFRFLAMMALFLGLLSVFWGFLIVARFVSQEFGEIGVFTWIQGLAAAVAVALAIRSLRGDRAGCYFVLLAFIAISVSLFSAYRVHSIYLYLIY